MANVSSTNSGRTKPTQRSGARDSQARESDTQELSPERDPMYDLVSVLYHGLQGADQCSIYAQDADDAGDGKLADFLREAGKTQGELATRAKQLLSERMLASSDTSDTSRGRPEGRGGNSKLGDSGDAEGDELDSTPRDDD